MKRNKGITMISLVVTIIVLIILAGVSMNMIVGDNGIITQAQRAARETANVTIASEEQMNVLVEEMNQYMSGNDEETEITINDLQAGDYIKYDTGVEGVGVITCRVLYPVDSEYGLQIISDKNVKDITLGGNTFEEARISYNNAIQTLNNEAEKYMNEQYATDARCVGSIPTVENGLLVDKNSETPEPFTMQYTYNGSKNIDCKGTDTNYTIDQEQMQNFNLWITKESYWLSSRLVTSKTDNCYFGMRIVNDVGDLISFLDICQVDSGGYIYGQVSHEFGLRPCILLRTDIKITGGDGKIEETAYTIGI